VPEIQKNRQRTGGKGVEETLMPNVVERGTQAGKTRSTEGARPSSAVVKNLQQKKRIIFYCSITREHDPKERDVTGVLTRKNAQQERAKTC